MSIKISVEDFEKFINSFCPLITCATCGSNELEVRQSEGFVVAIEPLYGINKVIDLGLIGNGNEEPEPAIADALIPVRCTHCGTIRFFDRTFVEEKVHGKNR